MSILEKFLILFDSNADELETGTKKAKQTSDKLEQSLSSTNQVATKLAGSFKNVIAQASGALLALVSAGALLQGARSAANFADRLDELSKGLDINIESLSAWGDAVQLNGGSVDSFQGTIQTLTASLAAFATKGTSLVAPFFKDLGIEMTDLRGKARNVFDILPELAEAFQKLGKEESFGLGQKLGLDQGTIFLLQRGRQEVDAIIARHKELGVVTKEDGEIAAKFNDEWDYTGIVFRNLFTVANRTILPVLTKVLEGIQNVVKYVRNNEGLVIGVIVGISTVITALFLPALLKAGAAAVVAFKPFFLAASVAAVIAALVEDIYYYYTGHNSLLGELIKKYPKLGEFVKALEQDFRQLLSLFQSLKGSSDGWLSDITHDIQVLISLVGKLSSVFEGLWKILHAGANLINGEDIYKTKYGNVLDDPQLASIVLKPERFLGNLEQAQSALEVATTSPLTAQTSNSIAMSNRAFSKNTSVKIDTVEVSTQATDADAIASAIGANLMVQMQQAASNFDNGVLA